MIEKSVSVYNRGEDGIYLHPSAFTEMGILIAIPPFEHVLREDIHHILWDKVLRLLEKSSGIIPHPTEWNQLDPLLKKAGCKSWKSFAKHASFCTIDVADGKYVFTPHLWDGKGFLGMYSKKISLPTDTDNLLCMNALLSSLLIEL